MTPLPIWLHVLGGILLGLLALHGFALWARRGGAGLLLVSVVALAAAVDAVRVLGWRTAEAEQPVPAWLPVTLIATLALVRVAREWRALGGASRSPAEDSSRTG